MSYVCTPRPSRHLCVRSIMFPTQSSDSAPSFSFGFFNNNTIEENAEKEPLNVSCQVVDIPRTLQHELPYVDLKCGDFVLKKANLPEDPENPLREVIGHVDLAPKVYEGGLKLWEGTIDLVHYLTDEKVRFDGKSVADIGCGIGVMGIVAHHLGAQRVVLQDYNQHVLTHSTQYNVLLNTPNSDAFTLCSGDWRDPALIAAIGKVDTILSCETIYNLDSFAALHDLFQAVLRRDGVVFLGVKKYYFGVGGGSVLFLEYVKKRNVFNAEIVREIDDGMSNIRHVLRLSFM